MNPTTSLTAAALAALVLPFATACALGLLLAFGRPPSERVVHHAVAITFVAMLLAALGVDLTLLLHGPVELDLGRWVELPGYAVETSLQVDAPGAMLLTLTAALCGLIGAFSERYLHQDPGYHRFFLLLLVFAVGLDAVALAGSLDLLYAGWEAVGLSSALLIAFYYQRRGPVENGLRAFAVYRLCDVALLMAAVLLHHYLGAASLSTEAAAALSAGELSLIGALLLVAAMGKAASFPVTGWLPRAMEGPTPSSAIFYGALSVHLGPLLLLRAWPLLEGSDGVRAAIVGVGLLTALHASMTGRVQTDIKAQQAYASAAQVGVIFVEIGLGFTTLALLHVGGHAIHRTGKLLRAPSLIHDWHQLTGLIGGSRPPAGLLWERALPATLRRWVYAFALERWRLESLGAAALSAPKRLLDGLIYVDQHISRALAGEPPRGGAR